MNEEMNMADRVAHAWHPPGAVSTGVFVLIVLAVAGLFMWAVSRTASAERRTRDLGLAAVGLALYMGLPAAGMLSGFFTLEFLPVPTLMVFFLVSNVTAAGFAFSPLGRRFAMALPAAWLIAPQALRLPLELVLHTWHDGGTLPVQMTFEGHNFDIVSGILGLVVGLWALRGQPPRWALLVANTVGLLLLFGVMTIALLSSPVPFQAYPDPPLVIAFFFPYGWILPMCVSAALFGHIVAFRALFSSQRSRQGDERNPHEGTE
ncbi:MAG: hypothetical protein AB8I08_18305 [Sandaracinaceae bacterium]